MDAYVAQPGTIITFYSYKGGTGRSMALANTACLLAERLTSSSQKVLMIDWDLEAPGLHRFFAAQLEPLEDRPGIINYFHDLRRLLEETAGLYEQIVAQDGWQVLDKVLPLANYLIANVVPGVDLIKAGQFGKHYAELVGTFDWVKFYNTYEGVFRVFRDVLTEKYAYCLIDSRTGLNDISGVCTMLLPEKLVAVFTPNRQNLDGILDLVVQAVNYRRSSDDFRPLAVFPLPSRIELAEKVLREQWRKDYQSAFEKTFRQVYGVEKCNLTVYFDEVQIQHVSYYAYGENVAVLEERSEALSLRRAYEVFFRRLIDLSFAWEQSVRVPSVKGPAFSEYVDFDVEIKLEQGDVYALSVTAPAGTAQGQMLLPTSDPEYQEMALRLSSGNADEKALIQLGQKMFNALFPRQIKEVYTLSWRTLQPDQRLRIKLNIYAHESQVAALPWEFLYDPDQGQPALLGTSIVRYLPERAQFSLPAPSLPLKMLLTGAQSPSLPIIKDEVQDALAEGREHIQITVEPHLTLRKLQRHLRKSFHIWHFMGHSDLSIDGRTGELYLEDYTGKVQVSEASHLTFMVSGSGLRLVVLDADGSARIATDLYSSIAPALIEAKVSAVIAMQGAMPEVAVQAFTGEFYRSLAEGHPVDTCMTEGRRAVVNAIGSGYPYWGFPVMYTSAPVMRLFEPPLPSL